MLLVVGGDENSLMSISGMIDPENIGKITGALNIDVEEKNSSDVKYYINI